MATNNQSFFSPYRYSLRHRRLGSNPYEISKSPYVKTGHLSEDVYVLSKEKPNWYAFATTDFLYGSDDLGNIKFRESITSISIVKAAQTCIESSALNLVNMMNRDIPSVKVDLHEDDSQMHWTSKNEVTVKVGFNDPVDCVVIVDRKYENVEKRHDLSSHTMVIRFGKTFNKDEHQSIEVIVYPIDGIDSFFRCATIWKDAAKYDCINDMIYCENPFSSSKVIPLLFNDSRFIISTKNADINPTRVMLHASDDLIVVKSKIENDLADANDRLTAIRSENPEITARMLYCSNSEFRTLTDKQKSLQEQLNDIGDHEYKFKFTKILLYSYNRKFYHTILQQNVNADDVTWKGSRVIINHNLNANVNFVIDDSESGLSYEALKVSSNTIEIRFTERVPKACSIRVFSIG